MPYSTATTFAEEQAKLEGVYPVDMYVINASLTGVDYLYYANINQDVCGWSLNATGDVSTATTTYTGLPIERGELNTNTQGEISEVSISIPNTNRVIESIIQNYDYLRGREVYFISTFAKHLPEGSSARHLGTEEDRFAVLKEKLYIDSVTSNEEAVSFTCRSKFNIKNITIPRRKFTRECSWAQMDRYRGTECDPSSNISATTFPTCDGTLDNCRERSNTERYGGFPSVPRRGFIIIG